MKKATTCLILFVVIPMLIGALIYTLARPDNLIMFEWFNKIGIGEKITNLRYATNINNLLNNWIIYNLPSWIWTFSFTVLLGIIWNYRIDKETILLLLSPSLLGLVYEICQKIGFIKGTFDFVDLLFVITGGISGLFLIKFLNIKLKIN